jgi:hypothetical protein
MINKKNATSNSKIVLNVKNGIFFLPLLNLDVGAAIAIADLMLVVLADVEDIGVGLRDAPLHQVEMLDVGLELQLLVAPNKLQDGYSTS